MLNPSFSPLFIILAFSIFFSSQLYGAHILVDPGHGGKDLGAVVGPYQEAQVVWPWALALKKELTQLGFKVTLSRSETKTPRHENRVYQLKNSEFDAVISLHANYLQDPRVKGLEYYILNPLNLEDQSLLLAHEETKFQGQFQSDRDLHVRTIVDDLKKQAQLRMSLRLAQTLQKKWPGRIKQGPFEILASSQAPAVLVELGFLSSPVDQKSLTNPEYINQQSRVIASALKDMFKSNRNSQFE